MRQSKRILIVDDEPEILNVYRDILNPKTASAPIKSSRTGAAEKKTTVGAPAQAAFELTLVSNGEAAVTEVKNALAEGRPFAIGFFDVLLGRGIDGIETVKQIHQVDKEMYAVLVTAYHDRHVDAIQSVFGEAFEDRWDYLNKPFSEGEILQKARNMISMWNLRRREEDQRARLDEVKTQLNESEKVLTIAAVARSVGHEFGNILLQIMGRADLSRKSSAPEMAQALETILVATEHASQVLERFKNLAKPHDLHKRAPLKIVRAVRETLTLMGHELKARGIEAIVDIPELPTIIGSHTTLVQVFMNLVINATHAMKNGGKIEFRGRVVNDEVEITVRDTGAGIAKENLDKIFQPFFTTKGDDGTGLGLSICKEIIEITHGGTISAVNHAAGGAEFRLLIPIYVEKETRQEVGDHESA